MATHRDSPEATTDDRHALKLLVERCSAQVDVLPWDAPDAAWESYIAVLIRSTWDYHLRHEAFLAWADNIEAAGTALWNPAPVVRWNADKRYLLDLERAGVSVVPTSWIARGTSVELGVLLHDRGWGRAVVKPSVAATAFRTWVTSPERAEASQEPLAEVLSEADALIQPFLPEVQNHGEWSFVFFAGRDRSLVFSHAVLKRPASGEFRVQPLFGGTVHPAEPPPELRRQVGEVAEQVGCLAPRRPLYARLDGVVSSGVVAPAGTFLLMEAELIEPVLFLGAADHAPTTFATAVARMMANRA